MQTNNETIVLKFGGASVASPEHFSRIADIVIAYKQKFQKVVIVVSAMGDTTNQLIHLATRVNPQPPRREYDMLVSTGERVSISLLAMALAAKQQEAVSFTGSQSGIITCDRHSDARIINVKPQRLLPVLGRGEIAIVAGFQGVSLKGEITTLGRGGSDTTAVALGVALEAEKIIFFKDVAGIYSEDPKKKSDAQLFEKLSYEKTLQIISCDAKVLHERCVRMAMQNSVVLQVRSFADFNLSLVQGTLIADSQRLKPLCPVYESNS
jgi:aspartate kinase